VEINIYIYRHVYDVQESQGHSQSLWDNQ
jgi:hypothetical protein